MTAEELYAAFSDIDDSLLLRSEKKPPIQLNAWLRIGAAAACFCLITGGIYRSGYLHSAKTAAAAAAPTAAMYAAETLEEEAVFAQEPEAEPAENSEPFADSDAVYSNKEAERRSALENASAANKQSILFQDYEPAVCDGGSAEAECPVLQLAEGWNCNYEGDCLLLWPDSEPDFTLQLIRPEAFDKPIPSSDFSESFETEYGLLCTRFAGTAQGDTDTVFLLEDFEGEMLWILVSTHDSAADPSLWERFDSDIRKMLNTLYY